MQSPRQYSTVVAEKIMYAAYSISFFSVFNPVNKDFFFLVIYPIDYPIVPRPYAVSLFRCELETSMRPGTFLQGSNLPY